MRKRDYRGANGNCGWRWRPQPSGVALFRWERLPELPCHASTSRELPAAEPHRRHFDLGSAQPPPYRHEALFGGSNLALWSRNGNCGPSWSSETSVSPLLFRSARTCRPTRARRDERMKGPRRARMPIYGAGSKYLGRTEKETEWLRFHAPQAPVNSHCTPTRRALEERSRAARRTPTTEVRNKALWR